MKTSDANQPWALVTGASAGIGQEFCVQLARRGYNLVLVARREDRLHALAKKLKTDFEVDCSIQPLDLATPQACAKLATAIDRQNIQPEFLVNNAGLGMPGHFIDIDWQEHSRFIQLMMTTVCELTWRLLPGMQSRQRGFIINVASLAGLIPGSAGHTLYGASKAFLIRFSESLAQENADTGIRVSALCPGFTYSEFHDANDTRQQVSQLPSWMWMEAEPVVAFGIDSVIGKKHRVVAIPGQVNRSIAKLSATMPEAVIDQLVRRIAKKIRTRPAHD